MVIYAPIAIKIKEPTIQGIEFERFFQISLLYDEAGNTAYQITPNKIGKLKPDNIKPLQNNPVLFVKESRIAMDIFKENTT